ncbi:maltokinase N-terminal cap-like domain-containing protein [Microbacterium deminutum]|uniref:Maltokinase n=1 Tax=Microbacterium deminutum TaxID=344164 RepID=A0ABN2QWF0_9MICO
MDSTLACLAAWMPKQRWYAAKGRSPRLRLVSSWDAEPTADDAAVAQIRTFLVADEDARPAVLYQVPVVARPTESVAADPTHVIGSPEPGTMFIDGPFDPAYAQALIRLVTLGGEARGSQMTATGHPSRHVPPDEPRTATVLSGEQSNTSLIYRSTGMPIICKVYRQLHPGLNPDIELPTALADDGSPHVPRAIGWIEGRWPNPETGNGSVTGSLASAQEFLPGVEDAWRVALRSAAHGEDFRDGAGDLGRATADVHVSLSELFPTRPALTADRESTATSWQRRLEIAIAELPSIAECRDAIEAVYAHAFELPWPPLQRIHGDYHLGQVLQVPGRGWVLLDFEGEPLRPMAERTAADLALRDVAGMLRSFDYVAGSIRLEDPDRAAAAGSEWAGQAREAFTAGYAQRSRTDLEALGPLLTALELDKAVYEAIYEARNRPTWVAIPLSAIERLLQRPTGVD